jgi:hypothetical protein
MENFSVGRGREREPRDDDDDDDNTLAARAPGRRPGDAQKREPQQRRAAKILSPGGDRSRETGVRMPQLDRARPESILEELGVPRDVRNSPCNWLLASSISAAFAAVESLEIPQPDWGGMNADGSTVHPMVKKYTLDAFLPKCFTYEERALVRSKDWSTWIEAQLFEGNDRSDDLAKGGFDSKAFRALWSAQSTAGPARGSASSSLREMIDRIWQLHEEGSWIGRTITDIQRGIYWRCYLGIALPEDTTTVGRTVTQQDIAYLNAVKQIPGLSPRLPALGTKLGALPAFYETGSASGVQFRASIHASREHAPGVMSKVMALAEEYQIVSAKIASPELAGIRPDTIVAYLSADEDTAMAFAEELRRSVPRGALVATTPLLTLGGDGIGLAWDTQRGEGDSFGNHHARIFAESLFDYVANTSDATKEGLASHATTLLRCRGLNPDRLGADPREGRSGGKKPPKGLPASAPQVDLRRVALPTPSRSNPGPSVLKPDPSAVKSGPSAVKPGPLAPQPSPSASRPGASASKPGLSAPKPGRPAPKPAPTSQPGSSTAKPPPGVNPGSWKLPGMGGGHGKQES